jgi:predicted ArsR family transcriptional regulator
MEGALVAQTKSASTRILTVLKRGPKRGLTAATIADRANLPVNTTRTTLYELSRAGSVSTLGRESTSFGRPANLYAVA